MAVWASPDTTGQKLEWSLFVPGEGWSAKQTLPGAPSSLVGAKLVADGEGNVMALLQRHVSGGELWATRYAAGVGWDPEPVTLTTTVTGNAGLYTGELVGSVDGTALVVWVEDGGEGRVWSRRFLPEAGWGEPAPASGGHCMPARSAAVALNSSGQALVVTAGNSMLCATRGNGSTWDGVSFVSDGGAAGAAPAVQLDELGNGVVLYEVSGILYTARCPAGAACGGGSNLANADRPAALASNRYGDHLALWPAGGELRGSAFSWEAGWSVPEVVEAGPGNTVSPSLAIERSGNAMALWTRVEDARRDVWASRYDAAARQWSAAGAIETETAYDARQPPVGVDARGRVTAVWLQDDGTGGPKVMYSRFE